jgi:basic amino acid/polyamine antiporter, APA family
MHLSTLSLMIALCYSELATHVPVAGSAYTYCSVYFGEATAWFVGWNLILEFSVASAVVARSWSAYLVTFLRATGLPLPGWIIGFDLPVISPLFGGFVSVNMLAGVALVLVTILLLRGVHESANINTAVVMLNMGLLVFIIGVGATQVSVENYKPFFPNGMSGMFKGAAIIFFAYLGFEGVSSMAEEAKDMRDMPKAIMYSLFICTLLYVGVGAVIAGMVPFTSVSLEDPLAVSFSMRWMRAVVGLGAVLGMFTAMLSGLLGMSRIYYAMSRDGLIPKSFSDVDASSRSPHQAVLLSGLPAAIVATFFQISLLGHLTSIGACCAFILVCGAVLKRRYATLNDTRYLTWRLLAGLGSTVMLSVSIYYSHALFFNLVWGLLTLAIVISFHFLPVEAVDTSGSDLFYTPFVPYVPAVGAIFTVHIMIGQGFAALLVYCVWVAVGLAIYFSYGIYYSNLRPDSHHA